MIALHTLFSCLINNPFPFQICIWIWDLVSDIYSSCVSIPRLSSLWLSILILFWLCHMWNSLHLGQQFMIHCQDNWPFLIIHVSFLGNLCNDEEYTTSVRVMQPSFLSEIGLAVPICLLREVLSLSHILLYNKCTALIFPFHHVPGSCPVWPQFCSHYPMPWMVYSPQLTV